MHIFAAIYMCSNINMYIQQVLILIMSAYVHTYIQIIYNILSAEATSVGQQLYLNVYMYTYL